MNAEQPLTGKTEALLPGGEALVRTAETSFLLHNSVPGDLITFIPSGKRRGAERGNLVEVIEASADRVSPPCQFAAQCGGCAMQYVAPATQAEIKSVWVCEAFRGSADSNTVKIPATTPSLSGRRRLRWYTGSDTEGPFLGFRAKNSHTVVRHDTCICASAPLNQLRQQLEDASEAIGLEGYESLQAVELDDGIHLILEGGAVSPGVVPPFDEVGGLALQWWHRLDGITRPLSKPVPSFHDSLPAGENGDIELLVGPDDFIQGQVAGNRSMIGQLIEWSEGACFVVDLFSGIGNLSLPIAAACGARVAGAELNAASVRAANANARRLNLDASYVEANLFENFSVEPFVGADLLILDPPRRGAKKVCSMMGSLLPSKIVMVNCDVASGGRDGEILKSFGYRLHTLRALDLFPYAGHVEAMSLWVR